MRTHTLWPIAYLLTLTTASQAHPAFSAAHDQTPNPFLLHRLLKRQSCPSSYTTCTALGAANQCCPPNTSCARDQNGNVACCPNGRTCTGVISGPAPTASQRTTSGTSGFVLGQTTATPTTNAPVTAPATLAPGYSTVPNQFYPFIAIPNTYSNQQACLQAYSSCQSASTACFNSLAGQFGVTIGGIASGLTQLGATGTAVSSASSVCSSLSQVGCFGIQSTVCAQFGTVAQTTGAGVTGFVQAAGAGPRCTGVAYVVAAAAGVGMLGLGVI